MIPWKTIRFGAVTLLIVIGISILLSAVFGFSLGQTLVAVVGWVSVVYAYHNHGDDQDNTADENEDTDDETIPEPDAGYQSESHSLSGSSDTEPTTPPPTDNETTHNNQSGLLKSDDDILDEVGKKLADRVSFREDGTIKLTAYDDLNLYSQFMLYVIAKRLAYEDQIADTPDVTGDELLNRFGYTKVDLMLFLDEAGDRLTPVYSMGYRTGNIDYATIEDIEIRVAIRDLADIADWTVDEQQTGRWRMQSKIGHAMTATGEARDAYDNADDRHQPQTREEIGRHVKNACEAVQQYPVEIGYDGHWKMFSQYAEALLDFLEDDLAEKTDHCAPRMERALRNMDEQAQAETLF